MKKPTPTSCAETGHLLNPVPCPFDRNYLDESEVGGARTRASSLAPHDDLDVPLPVGRKLEHMDRAEGWFSEGVHDVQTERLALTAHIDQLPRSTILRSAFRELVTIVHKASKYDLYVGRTGASVRHLLGRFQDHQQSRGARWIYPVIRAPTTQMREEHWEKHMIRWVQARAHEGRLCCNNNVADSRGNWPDTEDCLIYVVACDRAQSQ